MPDTKGYSYNKYQTKPHQVLGNAFKGKNSQPQPDTYKTRSVAVPAKSKQRMGFQGHSMPGVSRPMHQRADTISGASLGKTKEWTTRGDNKKKFMTRAYSMNQVAMARIMKGNVNSKEGAYMKRGGDRQV